MFLELLHGKHSTTWYKEQTAKLDKKRFDANLEYVVLKFGTTDWKKPFIDFADAFKLLADTMKNVGISLDEFDRVMRLFEDKRKVRMNLVRQKQKQQDHFLLNKASRHAIRKGKEFVRISLAGRRPKGKGIS